MGRTLFVGCSHTMGYREDLTDIESNVWHDNNYAEIYAKVNNKPVVVMASAGAGNRAFPRFLAYAFKKYNEDFEPGELGVLSSFGAGYSIGSIVLKRV